MADSHGSSSAEIWKTIPGFEGSFEASSDGRIRTIRRFSGTRWYSSRVMRPSVVNGYQKVNLSYQNTVHQRKVHQLILETFVGFCPIGMQCLHGDGNKLNNRLSNLRWGTAQENANDRAVHGTTARGEKNRLSKLTDVNVREMRSQKARGISALTLSQNFGIAPSTVWGVLRRRGWKHVQ